LRINTTADTFRIIGSLTPLLGAHVGGLLAPNGLVYGIPHVETRVLVVDPQTDRVWYMSDLGRSGWLYGVMDVNGGMFSAPLGSNTGVLHIDAASNTSAVIMQDLASALSLQVGGALAPTGKLYFAPSDGAVGVLRIDSVTMQLSKLGSASGYRCPVLAPNGALYMSPYNTGNVLKVDFPYLPAMTLPLDALLSPFLN
jgi:hypothetical protein